MDTSMGKLKAEEEEEEEEGNKEEMKETSTIKFRTFDYLISSLVQSPCIFLI